MSSGGERRGGLQSVVLTGQVAARPVQPLPGRVRFDPQHHSSTSDGQLLPCHQAQDVGVSAGEPGQRGENATGLDAVDHGVVGGSGRAELDRSQALVQPAAPGEAAPLVSPPGGRPRTPHQRRLTGGHLVETAPHGEERVSDDVVHRVAWHPPGEEVPDRPTVPFVELREPQVIGATSGARSAPPDAHAQLTPSTPSNVTWNLPRHGTRPAGRVYREQRGCRRPAPGRPTRDRSTMRQKGVRLAVACRPHARPVQSRIGRAVNTRISPTAHGRTPVAPLTAVLRTLAVTRRRQNGVRRRSVAPTPGVWWHASTLRLVSDMGHPARAEVLDCRRRLRRSYAWRHACRAGPFR